MAAVLTLTTPSPSSSSPSSSSSSSSPSCSIKQQQAIALLESSCRPLLPSSPNTSGSRSRCRDLPRAGQAYSLWTNFPSFSKKPETSLPVELEAIANEEQLDVALASARETSKPIIIDWMAQWCRKCIYLKPKLEKLAVEYQPDIKFYYVDVNAVPQSLVKRADVTKMPTIQLWKDGEKRDEVIGGHKAWLVIDEVREMLQKHVR